MGKARDLFKKIRDTKGAFHAKMGSIKDRNVMDLTEVKILRRGGKTELYKKDLHDPDNHDDVITNLEPDMLESEKQESSRKTSISALLTMPKPLTVWITINCGKF